LNVVSTVIGISAMMKGQVEIGCGEAWQELNTWPGESPFFGVRVEECPNQGTLGMWLL
jgi:hypothetical protein